MHIIFRLGGLNPFKQAEKHVFPYLKDHRCKIWAGASLVFLNCNPKDLQALCSAPHLLEKGKQYQIYESWLCQGIFTSRVEKWTKGRKMLMPAFSYGMLKQFVDVFNRQTQVLLSRLRIMASTGESVDFFKYSSSFTLDTICETAMGVSVGAQSVQKSEYFEAVKAILQIYDRRLRNPIYHLHFIYKLSPLCRREGQIIKKLHRFSERIIKERREQLNKEQANQIISSAATEDIDGRRNLTFIDILLNAKTEEGQPLLDKEIREEVDTIIVAGFDLTATTLKFFIFEMCKHPEIQELCREEIWQVCGKDPKEPITIEQVRQLEYVDMCLKETLRLYPSGCVVSRRATANFHLNDLYIPANSEVVFSPLYMGRCADFFPEPLKFMPSRWSPDAEHKIQASTYIPFLTGVRSCIGQRYAMIKMKLVIAHCLKNFQFSPVDDWDAEKELAFVITLKTLTPFYYILPSFGNFLSECKRHTIAFWMGLHLVILTDEPEFVESVMTSNDMLNRAICISKPGRDIFQGGLLVCEAEAWHAQRKSINAAFQHKVLLTFFPIFNRIASSAEEQLAQLVDKGPQTLSQMLKSTIISGSLETTMGLKPNNTKMEQEAKTYISSLEFMQHKLPFLALLTFLNLYGLSYFYEKFQVAKKFLWQFTEDIMLSQLNQTFVPNIQVSDVGNAAKPSSDDEFMAIRKPPEIFIKQALELYKQQKLSWQNVVSNANGLIVASYETSSTAVLSTLIMLAMHPSVQDRLYEEVCQVFERTSEDVEFAHLEQLPYLDMVVNETLRLIPPIPVLGRQAINDAKLSNGLILPSGLQVIISIYHIHRRKDIWGPDAGKFDPNNFLPEHDRKRHLYSFMPFSKGPRNCIGWRYAMFSLKIIVARFIRKYRFSTKYCFEDIKFSTNSALCFLEEPPLEISFR
ncbi:uncharacterized protein LOC115622298 [Scaptodrosophila lebanonensis]|uniref:Uncharacterized protein LOC115622298 n=1 Tax=Drosophila lebanonensis TaxID=7225 RepID=A0A6J2TAS9_DROLE|nr:uncharacterized protein LOC115622298 [Scaptodrosophila lebanonensis]